MTLKAWIVLINRMKDDVDTVFFLFFFDSVSLGVTPPLAPRLLLAPTFSLVMMALMMMLYDIDNDVDDVDNNGVGDDVDDVDDVDDNVDE